MDNLYDGCKNYSETFKGFEYVGGTTYRAWSKGVLRYGRPSDTNKRIHCIVRDRDTITIVTWAGEKVAYYIPSTLDPSSGPIDWAVGRYYQDTGYGCVDIGGVSFTWKVGPCAVGPQKVEIELERNGIPADELPVLSIESLRCNESRLYVDGEASDTRTSVRSTLMAWADDFIHRGAVDGFLTFGGRTVDAIDAEQAYSEHVEGWLESATR